MYGCSCAVHTVPYLGAPVAQWVKNSCPLSYRTQDLSEYLTRIQKVPSSVLCWAPNFFVILYFPIILFNFQLVCDSKVTTG